MSYENALQAAGAEVLAFKDFGSHQGEWWAKVRVADRLGWINGSFGSCSGCDAFEAEFGWDDRDYCASGKGHYDHDPECKACVEKKAAYDIKLAAFGKQYLEDVRTQEEAEKAASENLSWDSDAQEMLDWVKANAL